ncbi:MAG: hypothetical protein EOP48_00935 [Sphingobacteriales bacterium]|nr:MAG: hypothetical protein EOP48_00935 [Sphingobacteriales bacterium]
MPKLYFSPSGAEKIMSGDRSGLDMKPEVYNVDLERINISKKSKLLIESIDLVLYKNSSKMRFSARVPLSPPEPLDVQLRYRKKGGGDFITIKNGAVLNQGPYEFAVFASGIILDVDVISDGRPIEKLGGLGLNGAITHGATSYDSKDVQIGKTFELASSLKNTSQEKEHVLPPMISEKDLDLEGCKLVFSDPGSSENESAKTKTIILSAVAFGPDGIKKRSTGDLKISIAEEIKPETTVPTKSKTGSGDAPLTMADYTQLCTLECPHSPPLNADGSNPTVFSNQTAMKISRQFKIKNQKVCLDFTGADMNDESTTFQDKASVLVFDVKTCKARTLFKAGEWPIKALSCK